MNEIRVRRSHEKEGFRTPVFEYRPDWPYISIGFGDEKDYFIENLSLLVASGMGVAASLAAISSSVKTRKMKRIVSYIIDAVDAGSPLWKAFQSTKLFPDRIVSLIRAGEESGRLPEHLSLVTIQLRKEKTLKSRIRSALMYPGIVFILACILALGSAWYVLPKFVTLFSGVRAPLPAMTRVLIAIGYFFGSYGTIAVPIGVILIFGLTYAMFFNKRTKFIGDYFLLRMPGIRLLVQSVELGRFGYTFGALLQAGFLVTEALELVKSGTNYDEYRRFYQFIQDDLNKGQTFKAALSDYRHSERYIPMPIQQLIMAAEKSGRLPETLIKVGIIFEEKSDVMSKDLATVLEPIILIIVGAIVGFVALAVLMPIYGLSRQI